MSEAFSFNQENVRKVFRVFLWTVASAVVALLISFIGIIEIPVEYAFVVPVVNTILVAVHQFVNEQRQQ